ncbi:MAG: hypothetical protein R3B70_43420 [Polyangiaceae bacterium]
MGECHRRYWIQQSYEKTIKAYALMRWGGAPADEPEFARLFLLQHSPLKTVGLATTPLSKGLRLLRREVEAFVRGLDNADLLLRIDATTPRNDPNEVSYRYPFLVDGDFVAPVAYSEWDAYQGNVAGALAAVERLLAAVKDELRIFARTPK